MSELHPLTKPFQLGNTALWRRRDEIREAVEDLRNAADEAMLCLEPGDELQSKLPQASSALQETEQAIKRLWPERFKD